MSDPVFVIAEAGVNHNGDPALARRLVEVAAQAGADAVKFQTFRAEELVSPRAPKAQYQARTTGDAGNQLQMIRRLQLSDGDHEMLIAHARAHSIQFLSTPFDMPSLKLLVDRFGLETIKVSSGDLSNAPLLLEIAQRAKRVILSTGMSTLDEVQVALGVLAFGFMKSAAEAPGTAAFARAFDSAAGKTALRARVVLLHCTTEYPAPVSDVNLRAMDTLSASFGLPVGYSDHTSGIHIAMAAVARGARVIEKHFTTDRMLPGPDHSASLEPDELGQMVLAIRDIERALGDGVKRPTAAELPNRAVARKSIVAARAIAAGETFTAENLACKRPADGLSPMELWRLLGTASSRAYAENEAVDE